MTASSPPARVALALPRLHDSSSTYQCPWRSSPPRPRCWQRRPWARRRRTAAPVSVRWFSIPRQGQSMRTDSSSAADRYSCIDKQRFCWTADCLSGVCRPLAAAPQLQCKLASEAVWGPARPSGWLAGTHVGSADGAGHRPTGAGDVVHGVWEGDTCASLWVGEDGDGAERPRCYASRFAMEVP